MNFSNTLAFLFIGLAVASPLTVRDPQGSRGPFPSQGDDFDVVDPGFAQPVPPSRGPKNSQGFTQESCDAIRTNFSVEFAAQFGCEGAFKEYEIIELRT